MYEALLPRWYQLLPRLFFRIFSDIVLFSGIKIMDELCGFNEEKFWRKMFMDDDEFENWLKDLGLLHRR